MHPLVLVPLLATSNLLLPVLAAPMEFSTPVGVPGVGAATLGIITPTAIPNLPALPKRPFRRDEHLLESRQVIGYGHNPPAPTPTLMTKTRRNLLDSGPSNQIPGSGRTRPHSSGQQDSAGLLPGLPAAPAAAPPTEVQPETSSSGKTSGTLLSGLPVSQAGGPAESDTGDRPNIPPPKPPAEVQKEAKKEPEVVSSDAAEKDIAQDAVATEVVAEETKADEPFNPAQKSSNPKFDAYAKHTESQQKSEHKAPPPVARRAFTSYYHSVKSRGVTDNKAHSLVLDTDPVVPPQNKDPDHDASMGLLNIDSNRKPEPEKKTPKVPVPVEAPHNTTIPAN